MRKYPRKTTQSLAIRCKALCVPLRSHITVPLSTLDLMMLEGSKLER
ncbi:hypothetical protein A4J56_000645 [Salmonella enterica subsp. diarizonae]|nr:hypothetical protein [Salmonella enterica subsp. diarizonae]EEI9426786.1 hypothetical protein [Salmonella enterica subsp. diarizonae]